MKPLYYGCHVSSSGGLVNAIQNAEELSVNAIQLHPAPPQRWNFEPFAPGIEDQFIEARLKSKVAKVFFHGIYLINLASPDKDLHSRSKSSLAYYLDLLKRLNGDGVIFHVGSLKDEADEKVGYARAADAINWALDKSDNGARLILEVAAGSGRVIGSRLEELAEIYQRVDNKNRVGFGLDSQHMWASGYNFRNDLETILNQVEQVFKLDKVWAIHLNDSKTECGSRKDRHENIGEGLIGEEAMKKLFLHPRLHNIPFILETPGLKSFDSALVEVNKLRNMAVD